MAGTDHASDPASDRRDDDDPTFDSPRSEAATDDLQKSGIENSPGVDADTDLGAVKTLPGTGGPDDGGDVEVDESELNLSGDSIPGHPKPGESSE